MIGTKKNTFQLELKNRFTALEDRDDIDSLTKNMTEMIQQSALSITKQRDHIEYVEISKTIKKKASEDSIQFNSIQFISSTH